MKSKVVNDINEIRKHKAYYKTRDGINAVIDSSDGNDYIRLVVRNYYGYKVFEKHFSYWYDNPVEIAKNTLCDMYPNMFRVK